MAPHKKLLEIFGNDKTKVCIRINPSDAYEMNFAFKNHRQYIAELFSRRGLEVVKYAHTYNIDGTVKECGLIYARSDSEIDPYIEVWGIVGVSVRPKDAA